MNKVTEQQNPKSKKIDLLSVNDILSTINNQDKKVAYEVEKVLPELSLLVDNIVDRLKNNGRLFYIGCGTSGRLGVLDAAECPPTFSTDKDLVQGIIAGGNKALVHSIEGAEDSFADGKNAVVNNKMNKKDILIGISANGDASYVHGALNYAKEKNVLTALICCNKVKEYNYLDYTLSVVVGPEVIAGSTRMKAGTATKMILNMISTTTMIKLNKVYDNFMVDLKVNNKKLLNRAINIISNITNLDLVASEKYLLNAHGSVKAAIVMIVRKLSYDKACKLLDVNKGDLNKVL